MRGRVDRKMCSRKEMPLLVRTAINGVVDQVVANAAVVEQGVALGGALGRCPESAVACVDQEFQQHPLNALYTFRVTEVAVQSVKARPPLGVLQILHTVTRFVPGKAGVARKYLQPTAVGSEFLDVENAQSMGGEHTFHRQERKV